MSEQPMSKEALESMVAAGGAWAPHPPSLSSNQAIEALGMAMSLSALQIKIGTAGTAVDRARLVAGELEVFGYCIVPTDGKP